MGLAVWAARVEHPQAVSTIKATSAPVIIDRRNKKIVFILFDYLIAFKSTTLKRKWIVFAMDIQKKSGYVASYEIA